MGGVMSPTPRTPMWRRYLRFWGPDIEADVKDELDFRRVQVLLGGGDVAEAAVVADRLWERDRTSPWSRLAEGAIFRDGLRRWKSNENDPASLQLVIRHGRRVVSEFADDSDALKRPRVLATHAAVAEALMQAGRRNPALEQQALELYEKLVTERPRDAAFLRATAMLSERLNKPDQALSCWRKLVAGTTVGEPLWYEAKFRLIDLLAETDPPRARSIMDQHKQLNPGYGPEPWASRLRELDGRIPEAPS